MPVRKRCGSFKAMGKTVSRPKTSAAVLAVGALMLAGSAAAQSSQGPGNLSFPRTRDAATVAEWLQYRTDMPLSAVVVAGPDAVFAVFPSPGMSSAQNGRRVRVVQEVIDPAFVPTLGGRSAVLELDVDCVGRRVMRQAFDIYGGSNLGGQAERLGAGRAWSFAEADTPMAAIVSAACNPETAPRPLERTIVAAVEQPPARVLSVPITEAPLPPPGPRPVEMARAVVPPPPAPVQPRPQTTITETPLAPPPPAVRPAPQPQYQPAPVRAAFGPAPMVVLGEFPSLDAARAAWASATLGSPGKVQRIELASGRFRALVDGYGSAPEAEAACAAIRGRGGSCSLR